MCSKSLLYAKIIRCNIYWLLYICTHFWRDYLMVSYLMIPPWNFPIFFSHYFFSSPLILLVSWALFIQARWIIKGSYHSMSTTQLRKWWVIPIVFIWVKRHDNYEKCVCIFSTCHRGGRRFSTFSNKAMSVRLCVMEADPVAQGYHVKLLLDRNYC